MTRITTREKPDHYGAIAQRMTGVLAGLSGQDTLDRLDELERYVAGMRALHEARAERERADEEAIEKAEQERPLDEDGARAAVILAEYSVDGEPAGAIAAVRGEPAACPTCGDRPHKVRVIPNGATGTNEGGLAR